MPSRSMAWTSLRVVGWLLTTKTASASTRGGPARA